MGKSLIQTANQSEQTVAENSIITLGSVVRRFGCSCRLSGNAIELDGTGYYTITASVTATPSAPSNVLVAAYDNGVQIPGAIATSSVSTAGNSTALPIVATVRICDCCARNISFVLEEGAGVVNNISVRVEKV